jgi:uridine kinase/predicted membrane protein
MCDNPRAQQKKEYPKMTPAEKSMNKSINKSIKNLIKNLTLSAMFLGIGLLLPFVTGQIPEIGSALLPMHIPALLAGVFCGPLWGAAVGFVMPLFRSILFGMPPIFPTATAMAFELAAYAAIIGICYKAFRKNIGGIYASLIIAMAGGRVVWGIVTAILLTANGSAFTLAAFIAGGFTDALPGILLQLFLIPSIVIAMSKVRGFSDDNRNNEINSVIKKQIKLYPKSEAVDLLKVLFQNEFGPGHLITDSQKAKKILADEVFRSSVGEQNFPENVVEPIGNKLCRLHIAAVHKTGLSPETLYRFFELTAIHTRGTEESFLRKVRILEQMAENKGFPASPAEIEAAVSMWQAGGGGLFSHSAGFKEAYKPAYRVVEAQFCDYLEIFAKIDTLRMNKKSPVIIAIDGRCGAGKTTLAAMLREVYAAEIIPTDHFFLRESQKTPERLAEAGGNFDYERFETEVITPLKVGKAFSYKPYDCSLGDFGEAVNVPESGLYIVEGTYSAHPKFADIYDLRVFLSVNPTEQLRRIKIRNPETAERFKNEWIPKEEKYFEMLKVFTESVDKVILK